MQVRRARIPKDKDKEEEVREVLRTWLEWEPSSVPWAQVPADIEVQSDEVTAALFEKAT
jgi:hypothetical protein